MKKLTITLLIYLSFFAQSFSQSQDLSISEVVTSTLKKDVLFGNAQTWITKSFGDYKSVVQFEDKNSGKIIIKGNSKLDVRSSHEFKFLIEINVKDEKYKIDISDIEICTGLYRCENQYYTDNRLLVVIDNQKREYESKLAIDSLKMSKKELKKHTEELYALKEHLDSDLFIKNKISNTLNRSIDSLKEIMKKDSDF